MAGCFFIEQITSEEWKRYFHTDFTWRPWGFRCPLVFFYQKLITDSERKKEAVMIGNGWGWIQWAGIIAGIAVILAVKVLFMRWWGKRRKPDDKKKKWGDEE